MTRPRLTGQLDGATSRKLTLVCAPAGFGKTTLLAEWGRERKLPIAWVSLDKCDNDPARFMLYVVAALRKLTPSIGENALTLLRSPQGQSVELVLATLINEISEIPFDFILVLDDYHLIETRSIHDAVTFLLDHLPPQMHLIISSRADPPLPLSRLLARGQLDKLSATELRFTSEEVASFLRGAVSLDLSAADLSALEFRTEGWIAGLRLAALSMRGGEDDVHDFVASFAGSQRYVFDYFSEEILGRQPERVQSFLLQTSVLDRLTGPLCDALMDGGGGQKMLEELERSNLFLIALDDERRWYRYHHLFSDFLRKRLDRTHPERLPDLHRRACAWYERNGLHAEAVKHALAAGEAERAADLVERLARTMLRHSELTTLLGWLKALPEGLVRSRPRLCLFYAWVFLATGQLDAIEPHLRNAERGVDPGESHPAEECASAPNRPTGGARPAEILSEAAAIRGAVASLRGDTGQAIKLSHRALQLLTDETRFLRSIIAGALGVAYRDSGIPSAAIRAFEEAISVSLANEATYVTMLGFKMKAGVQKIQGRLHGAYETYQEALQLAARYGRSPVAGVARVGIGELLREWNELDAAAGHLSEGIELGKRGGDVDAVLNGHVSLARVEQARGNPSRASGLLQEAKQLAQRYGNAPAVAQIEAWQARLWVVQNNLWAADRWVREHRFEADENLSFPREFEHLTLVRVLVARGRNAEVLVLLDRLLRAAEEGERYGSMIEILVLRSLALQAEESFSTAMSALRRGLSLAEPEGYVRIFVDEGPPLAALLREVREGLNAETSAVERGGSTKYVNKLLAALGENPKQNARVPVEQLSERELEILRLLASGVSNQGIAERLLISLNTVKSHLKHTYGKLDVHSRTQAVARARELDLL